MFSNNQLKDLIEGKVIGTTFPYDINDEHEIEAHIHRLFYRIKRIPNIICEAEWDHFGSGYASFVEFFCYEKEGIAVEENRHGIQDHRIESVLINISRLAPVVIMGEDDRTKRIRSSTEEVLGGSNGSILGRQKLSHVDQRFYPIMKKLAEALEEFDYTLLSIDDMNQPLPFSAKIATLYRTPKEYLIADAIFYWED